MANSVFSVHLSIEAFERLCEIREYLSNEIDAFIPLKDVCSTIIMQITLPEEI